MPRGKKNRRVFINYILDESGSMSWTVGVPQVIDGFNEYVSGLRRDGKGEILFTLTKFSLLDDIVYNALPIQEVPDLTAQTYIPGAGTALYDAITNTVRRIDSEVQPNDKVITVIMTDGQENSSKENTEKNVADLIAAKQKDGNWTFVFLGADQDAWATARNFNIPVGNVMSYASHQHTNTMRGLTTATVGASASPALSSISYFQDAGQTAQDYEDDGNLKLWTPDQKKKKVSSNTSNSS